MELQIGQAVLRISNQTDSRLLEQTLKLIGAFLFCGKSKKDDPAVFWEGTEKVDYTVYIWYNVSIKYRRCFYDRTTAEIDAKSIHGNI